MPLTLVIKKIRFPAIPISQAITVSLYIKQYYSPDSSYTLIDSGVNVDVNGNITDSPPPSTSIDPTIKYVLKAVNELCGDIYTQAVILHPYCPIGFDLSPDETFCFQEQTTDATPPSGGGEPTVAETNVAYSTCGSYIYDPGYNLNGTGTSNQITLANPFWKNGGTCVDNNTADGPLNRAGLWATTLLDNQTIGFSVCITLAETKTYYVAIGCDNLGIIKLDGVEIVHQDPTALGIQYGVGPAATFKVWHIYPVQITAGLHIVEMIGFNVSGAAALGCEIYNNTAAEIIAATGYGGLDLVFSSKDFIGMDVQLGSDNLGYSCPSGYSLQTCSSPFICRKVIVTNVLI